AAQLRARRAGRRPAVRAHARGALRARRRRFGRGDARIGRAPRRAHAPRARRRAAALPAAVTGRRARYFAGASASERRFITAPFRLLFTITVTVALPAGSSTTPSSGFATNFVQAPVDATSRRGSAAAAAAGATATTTSLPASSSVHAYSTVTP